MRILIQSIGSAEWMGGSQYLRNLINSVKEYDSTHEFISFGESLDKSHQLSGHTQPVSEQAMLNAAYDLLEKEKMNFAAIMGRRSFFQKLKNRIFKDKPKMKTQQEVMEIERQRRLNETAQLFDVSYLIEDSAVTQLKPNLQWIADFQHFVEPSFFSPAELTHRDQQFIKKISEATLLILSSVSAKKDFMSFCDAFQLQAKEKARVLHFATPMTNFPSLENLNATIEKYHLPKKFFLLPNQFWKHKNHSIVIEAVALAKKNIPEICVVMTGNTHDYRHPNYFQELMQKVSLRGVNENIRIVGMIPTEDLKSLMLRAHAFINPSFFEGWSTTVEEAKVLGKRLVLSDIEVHREQNPSGAQFFNPKSPDELSAILCEVWSSSGQNDSQLQQSLSSIEQESQRKSRQFAKDFLEIAAESVKIWQKEKLSEKPIEKPIEKQSEKR